MKAWRKIAIGGLVTLIGTIAAIDFRKKTISYTDIRNKIINNDPNITKALELENKFYLYHKKNIDPHTYKRKFLAEEKIRKDPTYLNKRKAKHEKNILMIEEYNQLLSQELTTKLEKWGNYNLKAINQSVLYGSSIFICSLGVGYTAHQLHKLKKKTIKLTPPKPNPPSSSTAQQSAQTEPKSN